MILLVPEPFGPSNPWICPRSTRKLRLSTARSLIPRRPAGKSFVTPSSSMAGSLDGEAAEFARADPCAALDFSNVAMHPLLQGRHEGRHLRRPPLGFELDATVGQVADKTRDLELLRHLQRRIAKAHALHAPAEED